MAVKTLKIPNQKMNVADKAVVSLSRPNRPAIASGAISMGMLRMAATETEMTIDIQQTSSACSVCFAPQLRAIKAVAATDRPIRIACTTKNILCPVVTAATGLVPNWATIFMCRKPTVVNNRFEMIVGQANRQTLRLAEDDLYGAETGNVLSRWRIDYLTSAERA